MCIKEESEIKIILKRQKCFIVVRRVDNQEDTLIMALYASSNMALKHVRWEQKDSG